MFTLEVLHGVKAVGIFQLKSKLAFSSLDFKSV